MGTTNPLSVVFCSYSDYGELCLSIRGKPYSYFGVERRDLPYIKKLIKVGATGRLLVHMKKFSRPGYIK